MAKKNERNLIVGLDIGTTKVVTLVGEVTSDQSIEILGMGVKPSKGLKRGVVVNIEATVNAIQSAAEEAEQTAGCRIHSAFTGIAGNHIKSLNSHGIVAIADQEVNNFDIDRVIDAAKAVAIPADQKILHILPQEFIIDHQGGIRDPIGMSGVRLEARVHMITGAMSASQNIAKCIQRCGLSVSDIILEQLAASQSVLAEDEKELGVLLVDIGGGTTDMAIFIQGAIRHTAGLSIAGDQVTNDIAVAFRTPTLHAEEIKIKAGCAMRHSVRDELIVVPSMGDRPIRQVLRQDLAEVIEARLAEIFTLILAELRQSGFEDKIPGGVVLTGGTACMPGIIELAERILQMPVRLGTPQSVKGKSEIITNPAYATSVGLLLYAQQQYLREQEITTKGGVHGLFSRMKNWFQGNF